MSRIVAALLKQFGPTTGGSVGPPPSSPVLSAADNGNDTGATATISGASAGTTNLFYAAPWSGGMVPGSWTSYGNRVGNGTKTLPLAAGYWWIYCLSTGSDLQQAISNVTAVRVTTGAADVFEQCLNGVLAKIQGLSLTGLLSTSLAVSKFPHRRALPDFATIPAISGGLVCPLRDSMQPVTSGQNDIAYEVLVTLWYPSNKSLTANIGPHLKWRKTILDSFQVVSGQAALAGVPAVYNVETDPGIVFDAASFDSNFDVQQITVRCFERRLRGLV